MRPNTLTDMLDLAYDYEGSAIERSISMEMQAVAYSESFDASYAERQRNRDADRNQWQNVILPNIQKRAMLARMQ